MVDFSKHLKSKSTTTSLESTNNRRTPKMGSTSERNNSRRNPYEEYDDYPQEETIQVDSEETLVKTTAQLTDDDFYITPSLSNFNKEVTNELIKEHNRKSFTKKDNLKSEQQTNQTQKKEQPKMATPKNNNTPSSKVSFTRTNQTTPNTQNDEFMKPLPRKVNKVGQVADHQTLSDYAKFIEVENVPLIFNSVEFKMKFYNGENRESAYVNATVIETGEDIKLIGSANMPVRQLKHANENFTFPFSGQLIQEPTKNNQSRWIIVDVPDDESDEQSDAE